MMEYRLKIKENRENISVTYDIIEGRRRTGRLKFPIGGVNTLFEIKRDYEDKVTKIEIPKDSEKLKGELLRICNSEGKCIGKIIDTSQRKKKEFTGFRSGIMYYCGVKYYIRSEKNVITIKRHIHNHSVIEVVDTTENGIVYSVESDNKKYIIPAIISTIAYSFLNYARYDIHRYKKEISKIQIATEEMEQRNSA